MSSKCFHYWHIRQYSLFFSNLRLSISYFDHRWIHQCGQQCLNQFHTFFLLMCLPQNLVFGQSLLLFRCCYCWLASNFVTTFKMLFFASLETSQAFCFVSLGIMCKLISKMFDFFKVGLTERCNFCVDLKLLLSYLMHYWSFLWILLSF